MEIAEAELIEYQYSWNDGNIYSFLHSQTFEEVQLGKDDIPEREFLIEGQSVKLSKYNDKVLGIILPKTQIYEVTEVDITPTKMVSSGSNYKAVLNSGATILVPEFIKKGQKIKVNLEEKRYMERVN